MDRIPDWSDCEDWTGSGVAESARDANIQAGFRSNLELARDLSESVQRVIG